MRMTPRSVSKRCRTTSEHIAIHALGRLDGSDHEKWRDLLLLHHDALLDGVRAPVADFKDFKNHVLLLDEGEWGGARDAATEWYGEAVAFLRSRRWSKAAYALGAACAYAVSPTRPLHTVQSEEAGALRLGIERAVYGAWPKIQEQLEADGYPDVALGDGPGCVSDLVLSGAQRAHPKAQTVLEHFDIEAAQRGALDQTLFDTHTDLVGYAIGVVAALVRRAGDEAACEAPTVRLAVPSYLSLMDAPRHWMGRGVAGAQDKRRLAKMGAEYARTGKVVRALPEADKRVRALHARQVARVSLKDLDAQPLNALGGMLEREAVAKPVATQSETVSPQPKSEAPPPKAKPARKPDVTLPAPVADPEIEVADEDTASTLEPTHDAVSEQAPELGTRDAVEFEARLDDEPDLDDAIVDLDLEGEEPLDPDVEARLEEEVEADIEAEEAEREADALVVLDEDDALGIEDWAPERLEGDATVSDGLLLDDDVVRLLEDAGIETIEDLLIADAVEILDYIDGGDLNATEIADWQDQARLMMSVGGLRALDAQILVAAGIRTSAGLAAASADDVFSAALDYLDAVYKDGPIGDDETEVELSDVEWWIGLAKAQSEPPTAA